MRRAESAIAGALAGALGTLALAASDRLERRALGRRPVYAPAQIAARLFGVRPGGRARVVGAVLRWSYGPLIGLIGSRVVPPRRGWSWRRALGLGAAVHAFELLALPLTGATPALARWPRMERLSLAFHTTIFGVAAELGRRALTGA